MFTQNEFTHTIRWRPQEKELMTSICPILKYHMGLRALKNNNNLRKKNLDTASWYSHLLILQHCNSCDVYDLIADIVKSINQCT